MRTLLLFVLLVAICTPAAAEELPDVSCHDEHDAAELAYAFRRSKPSFDARLTYFIQSGDCWEGERPTGIATTYPIKPRS